MAAMTGRSNSSILIEDPLAPGDEGNQRIPRDLQKLGNIRAGYKRFFTRPRDDDPFRFRILRQFVENFIELGQDRTAQGVQSRLVVNGDNGDSLFDLVGNEFLLHENLLDEFQSFRVAGFIKSLLERYPGESRGPDVTRQKLGTISKTGFRPSPE